MEKAWEDRLQSSLDLLLSAHVSNPVGLDDRTSLLIGTPSSSISQRDSSFRALNFHLYRKDPGFLLRTTQAGRLVLVPLRSGGSEPLNPSEERRTRYRLNPHPQLHTRTDISDIYDLETYIKDIFEDGNENSIDLSEKIALANQILAQIYSKLPNSGIKADILQDKPRHAYTVGKNMKVNLPVKAMPFIFTISQRGSTSQDLSHLFKIYKSSFENSPSKVTSLQSILKLAGVKREYTGKIMDPTGDGQDRSRQDFTIGAFGYSSQESHGSHRPIVSEPATSHVDGRQRNEEEASQEGENYIQPSRGKRPNYYNCHNRQVTAQMLREYFTTGKLCGSYVLPFRFGIGK
ncbi:hypothetical protein EGW08_014069 [Elysia chlorotica]|uniref:Uncharacterized protein n=1 Tax=Elysia chlorotica TaxID=188477 RepID=A0A433T9F6_ELYCH|nr:hypothetical protein EGW08_014069 [Elysia chlorotica]